MALSYLNPINEIIMAPMHNRTLIEHIIPNVWAIISAYFVDNSRLPINNENNNVKRLRLMVCPMDLIVICIEDTCEANLLGTALEIAFIFGAVNIPNPMDSKIIAIITIYGGIFTFINDNIINELKINANPTVTIFWGWNLSESLPASGVVINNTTGLIINISPVVCEFHP